MLRHQLFGALQRLPRQLALRVGLGDLRLQLRVVHLEQRGAGVDRLPFAHEDIDDAPLHLGTQLDGLHGLDLSCGGDCVHDGIANDRGDLDRHRRHTAGTAGGCGLGLVARGREDEQYSE